MRAPRALKSGPSERQHLLGVGREDSEWVRRTTKGVLPEDIEVGASLHTNRISAVFECLRYGHGLFAQGAHAQYNLWIKKCSMNFHWVTWSALCAHIFRHIDRLSGN